MGLRLSLHSAAILTGLALLSREAPAGTVEAEIPHAEESFMDINDLLNQEDGHTYAWGGGSLLVIVLVVLLLIWIL